MSKPVHLVDPVPSEEFCMEGYVTLGIGDELLVKIVVPSAEVDISWEIESSGALVTEFYEGASGGMGGGEGYAPLNRNRCSCVASGMVVTKGVSAADDDGLLISEKSWTSKALSTSEKRVTLKKEEIYLRKFISGSSANLVSFHVDWSEK